MPQRTTRRQARRTTARRQAIPTRRPANKDVISMLKDDHRTVEGIFKKYRQLGDRAEKGRADLIERLHHELGLHTKLEETIVYPVMREALRGGDPKVREAVHEHDEVDFQIKKLRLSRPLSPGYDEAVEKLRSDIDHHVKEEEKELFPQMRDRIGRDQLMRMGDLGRKFKTQQRRKR